MDHEEEPPVPAIPLAGTSYAKLYTSGKHLQCDRCHSQQTEALFVAQRLRRQDPGG